MNANRDLLRRLAIALLFATSCARDHSSEVLDAFGGALCAVRGMPATPLAEARLIPRPRAVLELGAPVKLGAATMSVDDAELSVPSLARVAAEASLELVESGGAGLSVHVLGAGGADELARRCGAEPLDGEEAYFLVVRGGSAIIAANTARGASRGAAMLLQLFDAAAPGVRDAWIADAPAIAQRGVLEGFYGPAWFAEERVEMLRFVWRMRMNLLVWAPKSDFGSRLLWRGDYPADQLEELRALAAEARALEVDFCAEVSPGNGILYGDPADRALLVKKLGVLANLGASCLLLGFDDIPRELRAEDRARYPDGMGGGLGEAQAELAADVFAAVAREHPGGRLGFVPTDYWTGAIEEHPEYTAAIAAKLPREAFIGWTGTEVISPTVTSTDVAHAAELLGRAPFMGDNYPVNDGARKVGRLQLGPVVGREAGAIAGAQGWVANAMSLPRASMIPLATIADQLWSPSEYSADEAWSRAIARLGGETAAALTLLGAQAHSSRLDPRESVELAALTEAWLAAFPAENAELRARFQAFAELEAALAPLGPLAEELAPWSAKLARYGRAGLEAMAADPARLEALSAEASALAASEVIITGDVMDRALAEAIAKLRE